MYRCSSLSISFRWIPNFYSGEKTECEIKHPCRVSCRRSFNSLLELFLGGEPQALEEEGEERKKRKLLYIEEYKPTDAVEMLSKKIAILQPPIDVGGNH